MKSTLEKIRQAPYVSIALVSVNVLVYIVNLFLKGALIDMGGLGAVGVLIRGEFGRIISAMFLHGSVEHLFNNMIILLFMGGMLERATGHVLFGVIYFLSGLCGNICSLYYKVITGSVVASIGASGAVFGINGLLLALVLLSGKKMRTVTPARVFLMIGLSLYNGFRSGNIDNAGHLGGLLAGFLFGCLLCAIQLMKYKLRRER